MSERRRRGIFSSLPNKLQTTTMFCINTGWATLVVEEPTSLAFNSERNARLYAQVEAEDWWLNLDS